MECVYGEEPSSCVASSSLMAALPRFPGISADWPLAAIGPYSQAIKAAGQVFLSQVGPWDPSAKKVVTGSVADQTRQMCRNAGAVLEAAGSGLEKVVKVVVSWFGALSV